MTLNQRVTEIAKAARNTIVHALKLIAIMTVLLIIVKNPTWDSFFSIILIFQIGRILWVILSIQTKINKIIEEYGKNGEEQYGRQDHQENNEPGENFGLPAAPSGRRLFLGWVKGLFSLNRSGGDGLVQLNWIGLGVGRGVGQRIGRCLPVL